MQALGLIETRGLLPAIECADVMLKTAQVTLVGRTFVGGGLVTIAVTGDVGAIKASVEAGVSAVESIGHSLLVSQHVIPRPHDSLECIVDENADSAEEQNVSLEEQEKTRLPGETATELIETIEPIKAIESVEPIGPTEMKNENTNLEPMTLENCHKEQVDDFVLKFGLEKSVDALKSLPVVKLRNLAREYKELDIVGRAISRANKDLLIQKLQGYYDHGC